MSTTGSAPSGAVDKNQTCDTESAWVFAGISHKKSPIVPINEVKEIPIPTYHTESWPIFIYFLSDIVRLNGGRTLWSFSSACPTTSWKPPCWFWAAWTDAAVSQLVISVWSFGEWSVVFRVATRTPLRSSKVGSDSSSRPSRETEGLSEISTTSEVPMPLEFPLNDVPSKSTILEIRLQANHSFGVL